jgi:hypothetical protein
VGYGLNAEEAPEVVVVAAATDLAVAADFGEAAVRV